MQKIAAWTEGQYEEADLVQAVEAAADDAAGHRTSFGAVVEGLTPEQSERCGDLIAFAFQMLDTLDNELQEVLDGLEASDKGRVITAGDMLARASYQLNQAFAEFRNQALAALGPTNIPNLNHLILVKNAYLANPNEETLQALKDSINVEMATTDQALTDLKRENQIPEVVALAQTFASHRESMLRLIDDVKKNGPRADFAAHMMALEMEFRELSDKVPATSIALRTQGETEFPDINYLLTMIVQAETGSIGDAPLLEALQIAELSFNDSYEKLKASLPSMATVLAKEEVEGAIKSFEDFGKGVENVYKFLTRRERVWLSEASGYLLDFAKALTAHKERLKELEELEGKISCPRCAHVNDSDRQRCASCGFPLPQNVAATTTTTFQAKESGGMQAEGDDDLLLTSNLVKLYEAVNAVHAGTMEDAAFLAEIEKFENLVNAGVNSLPQEPSNAGGAEGAAVDQVYDAFEEGVEQFRQGTELLRSYLDSRDEQALKQGVTAIDQGAKRLDSASRTVAASAT
jgi:hypothetical protein